MKEHGVYVHDKTLYQMLLAEERYSFPRDNGCVTTLRTHLEEIMPKMGDVFKKATARQLIEEIIDRLKCPEIYGGMKHRASLYIKERDSYRVIYVTDHEYRQKKLIFANGMYKFEDLEIEDRICFEDEDEWKNMIGYLSQFAGEYFTPYNDKEGNYGNWFNVTE